ncbi:MAG: FecR family protein [Treponema sp.]|nr:FecR family protein [Treponema sp.]
MKKKTRFKLKNDLAVPFWIAITVCLFGISVNSVLFHNSFFRALSKMNEEPIATITFKYKTAQRKFLDRVVWDRLQQDSPVYNGDTIHTAALSEATVWFDDGTILDLAENTMAQVFRHTDGSLGADLEKGEATVDASESGSGLTLTSQNVAVTVQGGSKISAQKAEEENNVSFTVQKGSAELADGTAISEGKSLSVNEEGKAETVLSVTRPLPNEKFLYFAEGACPVPFVWNSSEEEACTLTIAEDKDFTRVSQTVQVSGNMPTVLNLEKGTYYWRLSSDAAGSTAREKSGKVQIIQALKPMLLAPATGYATQYRTKTPSIRFIWTESATATAYHFAVSKSPLMDNPVLEQRSSSSSLIISTLEEGTYYWQVTPYYVVNRTGLANPSEVGSFRISKSGALTAPELCAPDSGAFVDKSLDKITLSWEMDREAVNYRVVVSARETLSPAAFSGETSDNYITLTARDVASLKDGQYFWGVTEIDSEGNESPPSLVRSFYATDGKIEQRTVFPPDEYVLWKPLTADTAFTWKSNIKLPQCIQIARDRDFTDLVVDAPAPGGSYSCAALDEGSYFWRIAVQDGSFERATEPKAFTVIGEIASPVLLNPTSQKRAVVRPQEAYTFTWQEQEDADYYRIKVYKGQEETPLIDENFITEPSYSVSMEDFDEGSYRWELQSYAYETELSSRRSSRLAREWFMLRKVRPVTLRTPAAGAEIDGWQALENPPDFEWQSQDAFSDAVIILTKKDASDGWERQLRQRSTKSRLPRLTSGSYEWTVQAHSLDELDISARETHSFTVLPIPPFDMPQNAQADGGPLYNADYLRKQRSITFRWNRVERAKSYLLEIFNEAGALALRQVLDGTDENSFVLSDLTMLSKGTFTWRVRAVRMSEDKKTILIDGIPAENRFTIDYNIKATGAKRRQKGAFYAE